MYNKKQATLKIAKDALKAGIAIGIALIAVWLLGGEIKKISRAVTEKMVFASLAERRNNDMLQLKNDFMYIAGRDKKISAALLPADNILEFVDALEKLAQKKSITQSIKFSSPVPFVAASGSVGGLPLLSVDYNVTLTGNITTLMEYLKDFEKLPYFSSISSIQINAVPGGTWNDNSTISIQAKLYVK